MVFLVGNTVPTVTYSGDPHMNRMQDQTEASAICAGGGGVSVGNNYLLDGFPITDLQNRASTNPSIEALEDVKVQVHTYDAEMGRTGGGDVQRDREVGHERFRGVGLLLMRPGSLIGAELLPQAADRADNAHAVLAQRRRRRRRADHQEQDVLLVRGRGLSRRPVAERQPARADRRRARRRFLGADRLERPARSSSTIR